MSKEALMTNVELQSERGIANDPFVIRASSFISSTVQFYSRCTERSRGNELRRLWW